MKRKIQAWTVAVFIVSFSTASLFACQAQAEHTVSDSGPDRQDVSIRLAQSNTGGTISRRRRSSPDEVNPTRGTTPNASVKALTLDRLRNAQYRSKAIDVRSVPLKDGSYEVRDERGGMLLGTYWLGDRVAFGDLNGDGITDAAVVLVSSGGGSGSFYELIAVLNNNGTPAQAASALLGDRVNVRSIAIIGERIVVDRSRHAPDDPLCCPSLRVTETYRLAGSKLVKSD